MRQFFTIAAIVLLSTFFTITGWCQKTVPQTENGNSIQPNESSDSAPKPSDPMSTSDPRQTALVSQLTLKVINPVQSRTLLQNQTKELGGFATLITDHSISFKIPPSKLEAALTLYSEHGILLEKSIERTDLTREIATLEGQLESKRHILTQLRAFFDDSNVEATLKIEKTMSELVTEIEQVKGALRVLKEKSRWAVVNISFRFQDRDRIIYVSSPFSWLNSVNLTDFMERF